MLRNRRSFRIRLSDIRRAIMLVREYDGSYFIRIQWDSLATDLVPWRNDRNNITMWIIFRLIDIMDTIYIFRDGGIDLQDHFLC